MDCILCHNGRGHLDEISLWDATPGGLRQRLYARKLIRRLWAEELHDAVAQSSGIVPTYTINKLPPINYAMQFPETFGMPVATIQFGAMGVPIPPTGPPHPLAYVTNFLDSFLRGDNATNRRDDEARINQALACAAKPWVQLIRRVAKPLCRVGRASVMCGSKTSKRRSILHLASIGRRFARMIHWVSAFPTFHFHKTMCTAPSMNCGTEPIRQHR